jgi:type III pantothenate kinase
MKNPTHLFIDISNSWTKWSPGTLTRMARPRRHPTGQLNATWVRCLLRDHPDARWMVSSVVPARSALLRRLVPAHRLHLLSHRSPLGIGIDYPRPSRIGADRLANAAAAARLFGGPVVVVDFGTAVTFDIVSARRSYLGGVIAPGLGAMLDYLHERTALLPHIQLAEPRRAIGRSTLEAMRSGAVHGYRGLVRGILESIRREMGVRRLPVIATGGHATLIARHLPEIGLVDPLLTLKGLQIPAQLEAHEPH